MRLLYFADSHITGSKPENRTDNYIKTVLGKLQSLTPIITNKANDIGVVICGGDLFEIPHVSDAIVGELSEILKSWNTEIIVVPGNHDIFGHNINTLPNTSLGVLQSTKVIRCLTRDSGLYNIPNTNINIHGREYYDNTQSSSDKYYSGDYIIGNYPGINILVPHAMIMPVKTNLYDSIGVDEIYTNAHLVLCSHYHQAFTAQNTQGITFLNPGATGRTDASQYNIQSGTKPGYYIIDISDKGIGYQYLNYSTGQQGTDVFDISKSQLLNVRSSTLSNFKSQIQQGIRNTNGLPDVLSVMNAIIAQSQTPINNKIEISAKEYLSNAISNQVNTGLMAQGYIPANHSIGIEEVHIKNFQSHKDTIIKYDPTGFNAIWGESNMGKTAINRAITWVLGNTPAGTDMISEWVKGSEEVSVSVKLTNNKLITRKRTLKSAGSYIVTDLNTGISNEYKGFGRDVPIEVLNAHNMPLSVNIQGQLEGPYLLSNTASEKAAIIGSIVNTTAIDEAIKAVSADIRGAQRDVSTFTKLAAEQAEKLISYENIPAMKKLFGTIADSVSEIDEKIKLADKIQRLITEYIDNETEYYHAKFMIRHTWNLHVIEPLLVRAEEVMQQLIMVVSVRDNFMAIKKAYDEAVEFHKDYDDIDILIYKAQLLGEKADLHNKLIHPYLRYKDAVSELSEAQEDYNQYALVDDYSFDELNEKIAYAQKLATVRITNLAAREYKAMIEHKERNNHIDPLYYQDKYKTMLLMENTCPTCGGPITPELLADLVLEAQL